MKIVASSAFACSAPVNARARKADTQRILLESGGPEVRQDYFGKCGDSQTKILL